MAKQRLRIPLAGIDRSGVVNEESSTIVLPRQDYPPAFGLCKWLITRTADSEPREQQVVFSGFLRNLLVWKALLLLTRAVLLNDSEPVRLLSRSAHNAGLTPLG